MARITLTLTLERYDRHDLWPSGFAANRDNRGRFQGCWHDQGTIPKPVAAETLFQHPVPDS